MSSRTLKEVCRGPRPSRSFLLRGAGDSGSSFDKEKATLSHRARVTTLISKIVVMQLFLVTRSPGPLSTKVKEASYGPSSPMSSAPLPGLLRSSRSATRSLLSEVLVGLLQGLCPIGCVAL